MNRDGPQARHCDLGLKQEGDGCTNAKLKSEIPGELMTRDERLNLPVVTLAAEHLVMGYLMRRNILAYHAPPRNAGYDIICIHPDSQKAKKQIRVQVKSRYQTDCDRSVQIKALGSFDYMVIVFQNIGNYFGEEPKGRAGAKPPEFYALPRDVAKKLYRSVPSGMNKVRTRGRDLSAYKDDKRFELIANALGVPYPSKRTRVK